jgi:hypothetical protein
MEVTEAIIDTFPVAALQDRYGIGQAQVYNRMEKLGIKPVQRGKVSAEQVDQLDKYDEFLKTGGVTFSNESGITISNGIPLEKAHALEDANLATINQLSQLVEKLAFFILEKKRSPLTAFEELEKAQASGWLLPSSIITEIIGVRPRGEEFERGSFKFHKIGKLGRESSWLVTKVEHSTSLGQVR